MLAGIFLIYEYTQLYFTTQMILGTESSHTELYDTVRSSQLYKIQGGCVKVAKNVHPFHNLSCLVSAKLYS